MSTLPRARLIALVGPRGAGKTTLGRALGERLSWPVLDADDLLAAQVGCSAGDYLADRGEAAFRAVEEGVCLAALEPAPPAPGEPVAVPRVVSLGGGAVLSAAVRRSLGREGVFTVFLEAPVSCLVDRLRATNRPDRPPLTDLATEDEVQHLLAERRSLYEEVARLRINTFSANVDASVMEVLAKMSEVLEVPPGS